MGIIGSIILMRPRITLWRAFEGFPSIRWETFIPTAAGEGDKQYEGKDFHGWGSNFSNEDEANQGSQFRSFRRNSATLLINKRASAGFFSVRLQVSPDPSPVTVQDGG